MLTGHSLLLQLQSITVHLKESWISSQHNWLDVEAIALAIASRRLPSLNELVIECRDLERGGPSLMEDLRVEYTQPEVHTSLMTRYTAGRQARILRCDTTQCAVHNCAPSRDGRRRRQSERVHLHSLSAQGRFTGLESSNVLILDSSYAVGIIGYCIGIAHNNITYISKTGSIFAMASVFSSCSPRRVSIFLEASVGGHIMEAWMLCGLCCESFVCRGLRSA